MKKSPISFNILFINIVVFLFTGLFGLGLVTKDFALFPIQNLNFQPWQFITHMFLHLDLIHIGFNMLMFISFAPFCEKVLGGKFLPFYILSGIFAATTHLVFTNTPNIPIIGASGAVYSVFFLFSLLRPDEKIFIFFIPIGIRVIKIITFLALFELIMAIFSKGDGIGYFAHLGGMFFGWMTFMYLKRNGNEPN
jgi:membrane associated rhomboid family serine protease